MSRALDEWIGKTDDTPAPPRIRLRVFARYEGACYLTGRKITPADQWELEHIIALINGGENRESNLAPALKAAHKTKTKLDVKLKAKVARVRKRHLGLKKPSKFACGRNSKFKKKIDGSVVLR